MFKHRLDEAPEIMVVLHWFLLSLGGGAINAGGFLATGRFVSHVTGFATLFGVDIATYEIGAALGILSVPAFFLAGAFLAGLLIDRPIHQGRLPHFDWVMGMSSLCLLLAAAGDFLWLGGAFGEAIRLQQNYIFLALLCLASGLQNAAITSSSGRSVRTTHMTGLTTDLGIGLARVFLFDRHTESFHKENRANILRAGSIVSFVLGSALGAWVFLHFGYRGFLLPALINAYAAWHGRNAKIAPHILAPVG